MFRSLGLPRIVQLIKRRRELTRQTTRDGGRVRNRKLDEDEMCATENCECGHVQFFTLKRLRRMFAECGLDVARANPASLVAGPFVAYTLARSQTFIRWNARAADRLPLVFASGWYFALYKRASEKSRES